MHSMKLAIVTCYKQPDYVRARTLRAAAADCSGVEPIIIKNKHVGLLRYPEVICALVWARLKYRPDAYLLTFRGYEILPFAAVLTWPKPLIYDEFINPLEWLREPRPERWIRYIPHSLLRRVYKFLLRRCQVVLADTETHAQYSHQLSKVAELKYESIPVSTDETLFRLPEAQQPHKKSGPFTVFYYGNMLPLHGLNHVLAAAIALKDLPIEFKLVGGDKVTHERVGAARDKGAHIIYKPWVAFEKLPALIYGADLCLGGPFGNTVQAQHVITGKTYQFLACAAPTMIGKNKATGLFRDKENCLLVPLAASEALSSAVAWAYHHQDQLKTIGAQGRRLYEKEYSQAVVSDKLAAILRSL